MHSIHHSELAAIAARVYRRMQTIARSKVESGRLKPAIAAAKLQPWAALAIYAGATLPESGRALHIDPARSEWVNTLATARDQALERHHKSPTIENEQWARDLCALANRFAFGACGTHPVPPYYPAQPGQDEV